MVNTVHVWVVSNGGPPKISLPRASKMLRPALFLLVQSALGREIQGLSFGACMHAPKESP